MNPFGRNSLAFIALCSITALSACSGANLPQDLNSSTASRYTTPLTNSAVLIAGGKTDGVGLIHDDQNSWIAPGAKSQALLYVSDNRTVTLYSYPRGRLEGTLRGFYISSGECVDSKADVFIVNFGTNQVFEYAHGATKRLAVLDSPSEGPNGCSIDPLTGNLAVATLGSNSSGAIEVYKAARGRPTIYQDSKFQQFFFCGYDTNGNLFTDGLSAPGSAYFAFAELPGGSSAFKNITLNQYIGFPGQVQWDGAHVAVGDESTPVIYQFHIRGGRGTMVGKTALAGATFFKQFWIQDETLILPNSYFGSHSLQSDALYYRYPAGGGPTKKITKGVRDAQGAVVSPAT